MRWIIALASAALLARSAAKKSSEERYGDFRSKSLAATPVKLTDTSYRDLTAVPRNYTALVLLTALDAKFGCQMCREFDPEWQLLAQSWIKGDRADESRAVFASLDFSDGRETFVSLGLQTAPIMLLFPPTAGPHAVVSPDPIRHDFSSGPPMAENLHAWIGRNMPGRPHPPVKRPIKWGRWIGGFVTLAGGLTAAYVARPYVMPVLQNRNVWAASSLIAILLFTSGHMYNHIRKVPYVAGDGQGGISYFAGGFQNQYGLETQLVAGIYGLLSFAAISLAVKVPRIADPATQTAAVFIWSGVLFVTYSFLLSVFRLKNGGYPFSLPPFI